MQLNRTGTPFTREERNKQNENWTTIENEFNNVVDTVTEKAFNQVVDAAKIEWLPPVNTLADIETTYPNATEGKTVMVRDTGKVYRKNAAAEWVEIQDIDPTAINEVDARLSAELAQTEQDLTTANTNIAKNSEEILIKTSSIPKFSVFGNQLSKLKEALSNPLVQDLGIVFIGDSITWGRTLAENGVFEPRDGTLSDPRDVFASPSFVNEFKRYIGKQYANGVEPILSNWYASTSGESIAEFIIQHILYPKDGDFLIETIGQSVSVDEQQASASLTGYQIRFNDGNTTGSAYNSLKFNFTGDTLTLSFGCLEADATYYDLYVDGILQGTFSTHAGVDGFVDGTSDNRRVHTFPYIRNKEVEIRSNRNGENTGNRRLRIEAIVIDKKIRISNQGINGATTRSYALYNLSGNTYGDGEAVEEKDHFVFVQLGTNDRLISSEVPKGSNQFKINLKTLLDKITPLSDVILMCANPATDDPTKYSFTMQGVRDVVYRIAKENSFDIIDNYAVFESTTLSDVTADGVHPNELGHRIIARNIINCLEAS